MKQVHIRMDDDLYQQLDDARHDARKSINTYLTDLIREHVEEPNNITGE